MSQNVQLEARVKSLEDKIETLMGHLGRQVSHNDSVQAQIEVLDKTGAENWDAAQERLNRHSRRLNQVERDTREVGDEVQLVDIKLASVRSGMCKCSRKGSDIGSYHTPIMVNDDEELEYEEDAPKGKGKAKEGSTQVRGRSMMQSSLRG